MTGMMLGLLFLGIHLIVCILVWTGIKAEVLKVKRYLMIPVIFVPPWGFFCVLFKNSWLFQLKRKKQEFQTE